MAAEIVTFPQPKQAKQGNRMRVMTKIRGEIEVDEQQIIEFVSPLIGFENLSRFIIYQTNEGPMYWLQSVDDVEVSFAVLAPFEAGLDPDIALSPDDLAEIQAADVEDVSVYTTVVLDSDPTQVRTNLRAPILLDKHGRKAKQVVLDDPRLPIRYMLYQHLQKKTS